jgi:hypothetical protein
MGINTEPPKIDLKNDALVGTEVGSNGILSPTPKEPVVPTNENGKLVDPTAKSIESDPLSSIPE